MRSDSGCEIETLSQESSVRPLRVLHVTNMYPTQADPAFGAFVASQIASVAAAGATVQIRFINGRVRKTAYLTEIVRIRHLLKRESFDLVHAHYGLTGLTASLHDLPLVVTFYGDDLLGTPTGQGGITLRSRVGRIASFAAARRADGVICMSEEMRQALPRTEDRERAHVIPNGVDTNMFSPGDRHAARQLLGKEMSERLVLFPSTPTEVRKRLDLAEAAMRALADLGMPARLWVVTGVSHRELPQYYRAADCLLLTSDWEGSPNVVKEALCCDLPVVSVDAGDARKWLSLTPGCRLVERDPKLVARGLHEVLCDSGSVDGSKVRAELSLSRIGQLVMSVYREAITRRGGESLKRAGDPLARPRLEQ